MVIERSAGAGWTASTVTMQGWRRTHEDAHILRCDVRGAEDAAVFAVLDGHGGHVAAHVASAILEDRLTQLASRGSLDATTAESAIQNTFIEADAQLRGHLDSKDTSGTTVVAAVITRPRPSDYCIHLAHSGDSRAVLCANNQLICSDDHKPDRPDETDRIEAAGGMVFPIGAGPMRVDGALAVSRALGDFHYKPPEMDPVRCKVTALPEVQTIANCAPGDWLLLACDGVFDVMQNEDVHGFVSSRLDVQNPGSADGGAMMVELLEHCLELGSKDNCTACLVQLRADGPCESTSRELLQGPWATAAPDVRAKYADFFEAHGFHAEANRISIAGVQTQGNNYPGSSDNNPFQRHTHLGTTTAPSGTASGMPSGGSGKSRVRRVLGRLGRAMHMMCCGRHVPSSHDSAPNSNSSNGERR
jgi:serine/threonine protein phosphatase PrpC